ncbi:MAG: type 1 glutamine amidotransferase domain-containing protein [Bacteroidota bacterium]
MSRFKKIVKRSLLAITGLLFLLFAFGYWFMSLIPKPDARHELSQTEVQALPYLSDHKMENRGRVLAVVTSTRRMGPGGKATGYELTELSRAYYVFQANGFEVDVASPKGGQPPVVIDDEDMGKYDFAFLNDTIAQQKVKNTLALSDVDASLYSAIYFVGGKGAMYDFPNNTHIQSIVSSFHQSGKVIGAVCHGPAALVNVKLGDGCPLVANRSVCSFTNEEELLLISDARHVFPFLLEDKLIENGASFKEGNVYLENVVHDQNLVTGQNPWSTWKVAETMINQMGYQPKMRTPTSEENAIQILAIYQQQGYQSAKKRISEMAMNRIAMSRILLAKHGIVAGMQWNLTKSFKLVGLLKHAKNQYEEAVFPKE